MPKVMTLVVLSMLVVGVNVPVQVTPPLLVVSAFLISHKSILITMSKNLLYAFKQVSPTQHNATIFDFSKKP